MQIKIIAVGSSKWERFIYNWGVSFLIGEDVLFDTFGKPTVFLRNIKKQNIDLSRIKHIVISHNHWDHISGLWYIMYKFKNINPALSNTKGINEIRKGGVNVYICPNFGEETKKRINSFGVNVIEAKGLLRIRDEIYSTGEIAGKYKDKNIFEQSLVIDSENGLIVMTGCAHPGILTILKEVKKNFSDREIFCVLGGFHLLDKKRKDIELIIDEFKRMGIKKVGPTHCSGKLAKEIFKRIYQDNFVEIRTGQILQF